MRKTARALALVLLLAAAFTMSGCRACQAIIGWLRIESSLMPGIVIPDEEQVKSSEAETAAQSAAAEPTPAETAPQPASEGAEIVLPEVEIPEAPAEPAGQPEGGENEGGAGEGLEMPEIPF